jgi:hypothetical protein
MKVKVKWIKSPRQKYLIPRARGTYSLISADLAKEILADDAGYLEIIEEEKKEKPVKVKDTMVKKTYTRPVKR